MKKFIASSLIGSTLFFGGGEVKAEWDSWGIKNSGSVPEVTFEIYKVDTLNNAAVLFKERTFENIGTNSWQGSVSPSSYDEQLGLIYFSRDKNPRAEYSFNLNTGEWTDEEIPWHDSYDMHGKRSYFSESLDGSFKLEQKGNAIIGKKANGEIHLGENSWITKEENGRQKVYAKDANGNPIPIDYTNGTKLLINGRDIEQSINNVGALSAALTGLPTVPTETTLACGLGTGTHGGDFAFSGGCASKVNEKLSINYAASTTIPGQDYAGDFEDTFSARAGFVWKLGKSVKPNLISIKAKEKMDSKINALEEKNTNLENKVSTLMAKLERLEKIALSTTKSKDLATMKLP